MSQGPTEYAALKCPYYMYVTLLWASYANFPKLNNNCKETENTFMSQERYHINRTDFDTNIKVNTTENVVGCSYHGHLQTVRRSSFVVQ